MCVHACTYNCAQRSNFGHFLCKISYFLRIAHPSGVNFGHTPWPKLKKTNLICRIFGLKSWPKQSHFLHFPGGDLSEIEAKIGLKNHNFMKKDGPKCLIKFYKMRISIKLDGFSKIIEIFKKKGSYLFVYALK